MCNWEIILFLYQPDKQVSKIIYCSMESCWQKLKNLIKRLYKQASRNNLPILRAKLYTPRELSDEMVKNADTG